MAFISCLFLPRGIRHDDTDINSVVSVAFRFCTRILDWDDSLALLPLGATRYGGHCPVLHAPLPGVAFVCLVSQEISNVSGVKSVTSERVFITGFLIAIETPVPV